MKLEYGYWNWGEVSLVDYGVQCFEVDGLAGGALCADLERQQAAALHDVGRGVERWDSILGVVGDCGIFSRVGVYLSLWFHWRWRWNFWLGLLSNG